MASALDKYRSNVDWLWHDFLNVLDAMAPYGQDLIDNTQPHEVRKHARNYFCNLTSFAKPVGTG